MTIASAFASSRRGHKLVSSLFLIWVCTAMCCILISLNNKISDGPISAASNDSTAVVQIRRRIQRINEQQTIYNRNSFGALTDDSVVIVIRVHGRLTYLRDVIYSLSLIKGIENSLLVFSHDRHDEEIDSVVRSVDFCKVLQIYYPHSIQTHPDTFPADSPNDCPRETGREEAMRMNCSNALHPDALGRYREAELAQTKHHWWWQMNHVFDQLSVTSSFMGNLVFVEDDHYIAPDMLHVLRLMEVARVSHCPRCQILSLGSYLSAVDVDFAASSEHVKIVLWQNTGLVLRRSVWQKVKSCAHVFCTHDDFHWEWSLLAASRTCLINELKALQLLAPRVYRIGECDSHSMRSGCSTTSASTLSSVRAMLKVSEEFLFPEELSVVENPSDGQSDADLLAIHGGWGDVRDHKLCLKMVTSDGSP